MYGNETLFSNNGGEILNHVSYPNALFFTAYNIQQFSEHCQYLCVSPIAPYRKIRRRYIGRNTRIYTER